MPLFGGKIHQTHKSFYVLVNCETIINVWIRRKFSGRNMFVKLKYFLRFLCGKSKLRTIGL